MDTAQAIRARRAVKHYDPTFVMPVEHEKEILDLARQSPTSFNIQNWRFVNVKDTNLRKSIQEAAWNQSQITEASLLLVLCGDTKAHKKAPERYWDQAPQDVQDIMVPMIAPFYEGKSEIQRDEVMRSTGMAAQTIMMASKALGYDSCPMVGFDEEKVAELIHLPSDHVISMIITIGKAVKPAWPKPGYLPDEEIFITDQFK